MLRRHVLQLNHPAMLRQARDLARLVDGPGEAEGYMIVALENKGQYNGRAVGGFASRAVKQ